MKQFCTSDGKINGIPVKQVDDQTTLFPVLPGISTAELSMSHFHLL